MIDIDLDACRPYPELEPELHALVCWVFDQPQPPTPEAVLHAIGWDDSLLRRARELDLVQSDGTQVRLSALGLLYVQDRQGAPALLRTMAVLARVAHEQYEPGCSPVEGTELESATHRTNEQLIDAAPYASSLGLNIGVVRPVVNAMRGIIGDPIVRLQPNGRDARAKSLEAHFRRNFHRNDPTGAEVRGVGGGTLRLTALRASGFRTLGDFELLLRTPLTVLVGSNGVGKSTVLDAIAFLARATGGRLWDAIEQEGGVDRLRTRGRSDEVELEARFEIDPGLGGLPGRYRILFDAREGQTLVEEELLEVSDPEPTPWLVGRRGATRLRLADGSEETRYGGVDSLRISTLDDGDRWPLPVHVRHGLARVVLIDRDPLLHDSGASPGRSGRTRFGTPTRQLLEEVARSESRTQKLSAALCVLIPRVAEVRRVIRTGEPSFLEVVEEGVPGASRFDELSAGMRQMLLVGSLHVAETPPCTILLEEPDSGLNIEALPALRDLLRSLSRRSVVIATTHSPVLMGLLDAEREVLAMGRGSHGLRALPLAEALRENRWLPGADTIAAFVHAPAGK